MMVIDRTDIMPPLVGPPARLRKPCMLFSIVSDWRFFGLDCSLDPILAQECDGLQYRELPLRKKPGLIKYAGDRKPLLERQHLNPQLLDVGGNVQRMTWTRAS
jgi:hypothetical protein